MRFQKWFPKSKLAELTPADCQRRRQIIGHGLLSLLFSGLLTACGKMPLGPEQSNLATNQTNPNKAGLSRITDEVIIRRPCTVGQLLEWYDPGFVPWTDFPSYGVGIWTLPRIGITEGWCQIWVNSTYLATNPVGYQLCPGDTLDIRPC